jgi:N-acetylmuramoyl-L-alanine amidase
MDRKQRPAFPQKKLERVITLAAALLVLIGGLLAAAAWRHAHPMQRQETPPPPPTAAPSSAPEGPLSGLTILVDPGHGGYDGGARCRDSGIWEKQVNLSVALAVEKCLQQRGAKVIMTRRTDEDLCDDTPAAGVTKKRQDMERRVQMAVDGSADMVLSIHMNEYRDRRESGPQVFYRAGCEAGRLLAGCMQDSLIAQLQPNRKRASMAGDYFILQLEIPSVLVECGFISNAAEEKLLLDEVYQERLAEAIAEGAAEYIRLSESPQGRADH